MQLPHVNYLAVLASGVAIFILGGLWYSVIFGKPWMALMGKTEEQIKSAAAQSSIPLMYLMAFVCGLLVAWVLAVILTHFANPTPLRGAEVGFLCWLGFAGATSFATALFSMQPKKLWLINSGYNLVSFVIAGIILGAWKG
jgi:F0F1-type ATP synthase assembly protein I